MRGGVLLDDNDARTTRIKEDISMGGDQSSNSPESEEINSYESEPMRMQTRLERSQRELRRLRETISFQIGLHLTQAFRQPWRLIALPITFPLLIFKLGSQRLGRKSSSFLVEQSENKQPRNHCIVLFPTNGVGFGHFTRMYAVAKFLRKEDPSLEIVFFTPMPTLHILYADGFPTYHIAGRYKHSEMSATKWNGLLEDMLTMIFETHRPKLFMFDGAFPYRGMLNAINSQPIMEKWWMRRGSIKASKSIPVDSISLFDGIIIPGEYDSSSSEKNIHCINPIKVIDVEDAWSRETSRGRLSVPIEAKVVYVQLGAGRINDIHSAISKVLSVLFEMPEVYVVLGESMLGGRLEVQHSRLRIIRDYPNSLYARGFDASVQAGGYNSYYEMRMFGIPTLFIPNMETGMDDQLQRCEGAEKEGWGFVLRDIDKDLKKKIQKIVSMKLKPNDEVNGASQVPNLLGIP